ncbi:MAG: ABC transporter permease subunit [Mesorhizobium sp.]|uniref:ABC transporter permease n=1 Tax=unclassified Mesorhizobium TaxID=325217 RepID=UPI000FD44B7F|nr:MULTISPECIES: ABC transporter permease [unclassified Mesorhizobium]RUW50381.1 ABC transporter permease [Mesorhizobium sp. M1A.F.Ca.ET.072.01.1.1]RWA88202.1 MAG: ABC transporter permease [Mesorhizobium sp.]RWB58671.1 MAG: ABC transporter permease [Mesorhizobium sp.]TIU35749.1 MAG: ABC transporter permease subunit [Mesorhizobium sp.]TIU72262.1 MAG: ABC transporter permease subunit [Mesorhizobium sp.]
MTRALRQVPLYSFVILVYMFLFVPIVLVIANSVNGDANMAEWGGLTTRWFKQMFEDDVVLEAIRNSLLIATATTAISTATGTLAAIGLRRAGWTVRAVTNASTYSRLLMPELVLVVGLLVTFQAVNWPRGFGTVVIGHASLYTAYVIMIVSARLARRDPYIEEAARDLGATAARALIRVTLPEAMPAILTASLLVFAFSMDNVITSLFLSSDLNTLPLVLFSLMRTKITPEVNAIATFMIALSTLVILLGLSSYYWLRSARKHRSMGRDQGARS